MTIRDRRAPAPGTREVPAGLGPPAMSHRRRLRDPSHRSRGTPLAVLILVAAIAAHAVPGGPATLAAMAADTSYVSGPLQAPGGPLLVDRLGRVVFLHGVNAVYKPPPFELYPDPGRPWNLSAADAASMARLGFDVVRLGILWAGLEPGTLVPNSPAVCSPGRPGDPHQLDIGVLHAYLDRLTRTVDLLGRYHIYSLLDMHQDVYSQAFGGEGAPAWAVCTDGLPARPAQGRWSNAYAEAAADVAYHHFWTNDVVGNLQGEYDRVWAAVASHFASNPWILGYDPYNEPFSRSVVSTGTAETDRLLECFYTGRGHPGLAAGDHRALACPPGDPSVGLIPSIERADPRHLVFYEPDIFSSHGRPNFVGPMSYPNLVLAFHDYCSFRSGLTGDPTDLAACAHQELVTLRARQRERPTLATEPQPGGPGWFLGEFGATTNQALLAQLTAYADTYQLGWTYWQWKHYHDPTGSSDEALASAGGALRPNATVLAQPYPQAVAGAPASFGFDMRTGTFHLAYVPNDRVDAPTVVVVPALARRTAGRTYCVHTVGGSILSRPGADRVLVANSPGARKVTVDVTLLGCPTPPSAHLTGASHNRGGHSQS